MTEEALQVPAADRQLRVNGRGFQHYKHYVTGRQRRSIFNLPVLDPTGAFAFYWSLFTTTVDLTYTAFLVPLAIAFLNTNWRQNDKINFLVITELIGNVAYVVDLFLGFQIGFLVVWDCSWLKIQDGSLTAIFYIFHGSFLINIIAVLPAVLQIILIGIGDVDQQALHLVFMLRLLRLTRVVAVLKSLQNPRDSGSMTRLLRKYVSSIKVVAFTALLSLAILLNLLGCIWWALAVYQGLSNSWASQIEKQADLIAPDTSDATRYLVSVYFVMTTITTIGYGDITPFTNLEVGISLIFELIGVFYFGYIISVVSQLLSANQHSRAAAVLQEKLQALDAWMSQRRLPSLLQKEIRSLFVQKWMYSVDTDEAVLYAQLPHRLQKRVRHHLETPVLGKCHLWVGLPEHVQSVMMATVSALAVPVHVVPGQRLYHIGEEANYMYILDEGTMSSSSSSTWPSSRFSGPAVIGLLSVFATQVPECQKYLQTITAVTGCHLWRVNAEDLAVKLQDNHLSSLQALTEMYRERLRACLRKVSQRGWSKAPSHSRQRRAVAKLESIAEGLEELADQLALEVLEQNKIMQDGDVVQQIHDEQPSRSLHETYDEQYASKLAPASGVTGELEAQGGLLHSNDGDSFVTTTSTTAHRLGRGCTLTSGQDTLGPALIEMRRLGGRRLRERPSHARGSVMSSHDQELAEELEVWDVLQDSTAIFSMNIR